MLLKWKLALKNKSKIGLWRKHYEKIQAFRKIKTGSRLYEYLVDAGVNERQLNAFISDGLRKTGNLANSSEHKRQVDYLLDQGGIIAGGAALKSYLDMDNHNDVDMFFDSFSSYVKALLYTRDNPGIDTCLYETDPCELFDLDVSKIAFSKNGYCVSDECNDALDTGISGIDMWSIIHPIGTLQRVIKYSKRYAVRFKAEHVLFLAAAYNVTDRKLVRQAFLCSV